MNFKLQTTLVLSLTAILLTSFCMPPREVSLVEIFQDDPDKTSLSLNHKRITDSLTILGNYPKLIDIGLNYDGIESIPDSIGQLKNLKKLSLYGNSIKNLPKEFGELQSLETLVLGKNPITEVPIQLKNLPNLKIVSLDETLIQLTEADVDVLSSLPSLEILDLSENPNFKNLPSNIQKLNYLKQIHLKKNILEHDTKVQLKEALPNTVLIK
ncbi:leucine-rich repeat domain-containing protein [Leptospira sp. GIMC2001]|uniref:leucine-rich repeat domain-containing protein n=1 Tax=Leptospira sp. GIMC2001 TaxID=1513297 RepID=UPI0023494981|nr:leucine-rich repeat domain-containing protein [Leptospira sp. GIMC2001]WCL48321.1 leucine-rich repeat domain-containing protein [Leptospira sp. GIMC2001]